MHSVLIDTRIIGQTPRHFGVNVEIQDHHDRCNLWDWLADSGATLLREFHPEKNLRLQQASEADYAAIVSRQAFDAWRQPLIADPRKNLPWDRYSFAQSVRWMGIPDGIVSKLKSAGLDAILPMGYATKSFPRPLVKEWIVEGIPADDLIDWAAAACAYEYYYAMIYRYADGYGITHFMLHNDPEYLTDLFHLPVSVINRSSSGEDDTTVDRENDNRKIKAMATQLGVLAYLARMAMEDVRNLLKDQYVAANLFLSGPASHCQWEEFWHHTKLYVDALDYHHYDRSPEAFRRTYSRVAMRARQSQKKTAVSEFNLMNGAITPPDMLFNPDVAMNLAALLMTVLSATSPDDPGCELVTLYHFHFPATHRNYKNLVYGDMNRVDWSGRDTCWMYLDNPDVYPTFTELQLRFPTLGYHLFRMLARCVPGNRSASTSYAVLDWGCNGGSLEWSSTKFLVVQQEDRIIVNILNPSRETLSKVKVNLEMLPQKHTFAIIRETSLKHRDTAIAQQRMDGDAITLDLPPQSLTQIIFTSLMLDRISSLRLEEHSVTPGTIKDLALLQTTRLRAIGLLDGQEVDLTDLNVVWASSQPELISVHQGGLLQRLRSSPQEVAINATTLSGIAAPSISIEGHDFCEG